MMKYKGYTAEVQYHSDDRIFFGKVIGIEDGITFQGTSVDELEAEFKTSVNEYLRMCNEWGREPQKTALWKTRIEDEAGTTCKVGFIRERTTKKFEFLYHRYAGKSDLVRNSLLFASAFSSNFPLVLRY